MEGLGLALPFTTTRPRTPPWGVAASIVIHAGLAALLFWFSPLRPLVVPPPEAVTVTILTPEEVAALAEPAQPVAQAVPEASSQLDAPTERAAPADATDARLPNSLGPPPMTTASKYYAEALLASPAMAGVRRTLGTLAGSEQLIQLCNIEGLEQLRVALPDLHPDTLVPYAMADMTQGGLTLIANGAAFRSRRRWFALNFTCEAAPSLRSVTAFAFRVGDEVPESEWDAHGLNAEDEDE